MAVIRRGGGSSPAAGDLGTYATLALALAAGAASGLETARATSGEAVVFFDGAVAAVLYPETTTAATALARLETILAAAPTAQVSVGDWLTLSGDGGRRSMIVQLARLGALASPGTLIGAGDVDGGSTSWSASGAQVSGGGLRLGGLAQAGPRIFDMTLVCPSFASASPTDDDRYCVGLGDATNGVVIGYGYDLGTTSWHPAGAYGAWGALTESDILSGVWTHTDSDPATIHAHFARLSSDSPAIAWHVEGGWSITSMRSQAAFGAGPSIAGVADMAPVIYSDAAQTFSRLEMSWRTADV